MMDENDIDQEKERVFFGLVGLVLAGLMACRLWRWCSGLGGDTTIWRAIAGRPFSGRGCWDYGFWELCPGGQLAAVAMIILVVSLIAGAILNERWLYVFGGCVIVGGYLANAFLLLKLMAAY